MVTIEINKEFTVNYCNKLQMLITKYFNKGDFDRANIVLQSLKFITHEQNK